MFALKCIQVEGENELFEVKILKYNLSLFPEVVAARAGGQGGRRWAASGARVLFRESSRVNTAENT